MSKPERMITLPDLLLVKNWAKEFLVALPSQTKIEGFNQPLSDGDKLALAYVHGVLSLLGEPTIHVKIKVVKPEGYEPV